MTDDDRAEVWLIAGFVVVLTVVMVLLVVVLPGPDEPEVVRVRTESVGPPGTRALVPPLVRVRGELVARFAPPATTTTTSTVPSTTSEPEAAEAPVEVVPATEIEALICSRSWDCATALRVARCESTMNPNAVGSAGERGLFQVHPVHAGRFEWAAMFDPASNVAAAHSIWAEQGWGPWSCAR